MTWGYAPPWLAMYEQGFVKPVLTLYRRYVGRWSDCVVFCNRSPELLNFYAYRADYTELVAYDACPAASYDGLDGPGRKELALTVLRRMAKQAADLRHALPNDKVFSDRYPGVWEMLTATKWPGSEDERVTSTVTSWWGYSGPSALIKDRNSDLAAFVTSDSMLGLWEALERAVQDPDYPWRGDRNKLGSSPRTKTKR
jgi:hypothetical protein